MLENEKPYHWINALSQILLFCMTTRFLNSPVPYSSCGFKCGPFINASLLLFKFLSCEKWHPAQANKLIVISISHNYKTQLSQFLVMYNRMQ